MDDSLKTILVVDDEAANRTLMAAILAADDREIVTAESGAQALACVAEKQPDLILLDIMMPDINGFDVLQRLKRGAATADIPVIMVTALDDPEFMNMARDAGAEQVLSKPVNRKDLLARVSNILKSL